MFTGIYPYIPPSHKVLNQPNPDAHPVGFPDGSAAKLILLGDEVPLLDIGFPAWWPTAISDKVRSKLVRRLIRQGYVLPILMSVCLVLLAVMYTTDAVPASASPDGKAKRRIRLRHKTSPIADFGVAHGSADVKIQDKFAYLNVADMSFSKGQDPDDHYWIYFTTITGQDCAEMGHSLQRKSLAVTGMSSAISIAGKCSF
jgi:hypothetical protein